MNGMNLFTLVFSGVLECEARDARGSLLRNNLEAFDYSRHNFMLKPGVKALRILADYDQIHIWIASGNVRQILYRPKVCVKLKLFSQLNIDAGKSATDWRSHRTLQRDARSLNGFSQLFGNVFVIFFKRFRARLKTFPLELQTSSFENTHSRPSDLRTDTVARNECDLVSHNQNRLLASGS